MRIPSRLAVNAGLLAIMGVALSVLPGIARQRAAAGKAKAASEFVSSLTAEQRAKAVHPVASPEWTRWNFIPASMFPRNGISFKEMNQAQRQRAHDLMKAGLSQSGYTTTASVMQLETCSARSRDPARPPAGHRRPLHGGGASGARDPAARRPPGDGGRGAGRGAEGSVAAPRRGPRRGRRRRTGCARPELYYVTVFGDPSTKGAWGWRLEGTMCRCGSRSTTVACSCRARRSFSVQSCRSAVRVRPVHRPSRARRPGGRRPRARPRARFEAAGDRHRRAQEARVGVRHDGQVRSAGSRRAGGRADVLESPRHADEADRQLRQHHAARYFGRADGADQGCRHRQDHVRVVGGHREGPRYRYQVQGPSSSSNTTTRRTTAITFTPCGATSTATSAGTCWPSTWRRCRTSFRLKKLPPEMR